MWTEWLYDAEVHFVLIWPALFSIEPEAIEDWEFPDLKEIRKGGFFLDGCKIHLHGFNPSLMEKVKKILVTAGGLLYQHPSPGLSHIVLAVKDEAFLEQLQRKEFG